MDAKTMTIFIRANIDNLSKNLANVEKNMDKVFGKNTMKLSKNFALGLGAAAAALGAFGAACINAADKEQETIRMYTSLIGSAKEAKALMADLSNWGTNVPFNMDEMENTAKKLLATGVAAQDLIPILDNLGNAAAMTGSGQAGIDAMTDAISRMSMTGTASSKDMKMLINNQVDAYGYLAKYLNTDVATAMDMVKNKSVDSGTVINALMKGMETDFKGGMDNIEKSLSGMLGTIQYNLGEAMEDIGGALMDSFGITDIMAKATEAVRKFTVAIKTYGVRETLENFVPPWLEGTILAIAAAMLGAAVPAILAMAASLGSAVVAALPFIAGAAAIAAVAFVVYKAWEPLGDLFSNVWSYIVTSCTKACNSVLNTLYGFVQKAINYLRPVFDLFGMDAAADRWSAAVSKKLQVTSGNIVTANEKQKAASNGMDMSVDDIMTKLKGSGKTIFDVPDLIADTKWKGWHGKAPEVTTGAGGTDKKISSIEKNTAAIAKSTTSGKIAVDKMRALQGKIAFYAADGTNCMRTIGMALEGTPFEGVINVDTAYEIAKKEGLDRGTDYTPKAGDTILVGGYDKYGNWDPRMHAAMVTENNGVIQNGKSHNGVYESGLTPQQMFGDDITGYIATSQLFGDSYDAVGKKSAKSLVQQAAEWAEKLNAIKDKAKEIATEVNNRLELVGLKGVRRDLIEVNQEAKKNISDMENRYRDMSLEFQKADALEQEAMKQAWKDAGIAFEELENKKVAFAAQTAKERQLIEAETQQKIKDLNYERQKFIDDLDEAKKDGDFTRAYDLLNTEEALNDLRLENAKNFVDGYISVWKTAHTGYIDALKNSIGEVNSSFESFFQSVLSGKKNLGDAFVDLLSSFVSMVQEMVARWAAAELTEKIFGGFRKKDNTSSGGGGSFLGNLGGAIVSSLFSIPGKASGGVASGLTLVGEYGPELVRFNSPSRVFNNRDTRALLGGGGNVNMYVNTPDAESFKQSRAQITSGLAAMVARGRRNS